MIKTCAYCKEEFDAKRIDKNYCSASCRQLNHLQRKAVELFGVNVKEESVKTSIDTSSENVKTDLPETPKEERNPVVELKKEKEYKFMPSKFVEEVGTLYKARSIKHTHNLFSNDKLINKNLEWINIRIRCLIEAMLFISERKSVSLPDIVELTNAFIHLIKSEHFKKLPENYPFKHFIMDFKTKLKWVCAENEDAEEVPLKLNRKLKIDLIVYRCELRDVVPKIKFSELNFKNQEK
jgi:hypothetical protein